jgi:aryl-alcohol dehydrogenase-like predicted oxidoreductase
MALLWCLENPRVSTVILGASRLSQLTDNLAALEAREKMTPEVMAAIEEIAGNRPPPPQRF